MDHLFANWNALDYVIAAVILISLIHGFIRGFVRGIISLATWFAAIYASLEFSPALSESLQSVILNPKSRYVLSAIAIFIVVMIIGMIIGRLARGLVRLSMLGFIDRVLGIALGFVRGALLVVILLFVIQTVSVTSAAWMQHSQLSPYFQGVVAYCSNLLPKDLFGATTLMDRVSTFTHSVTTSITAKFHK